MADDPTQTQTSQVVFSHQMAGIIVMFIVAILHLFHYQIDAATIDDLTTEITLGGTAIAGGLVLYGKIKSVQTKAALKTQIVSAGMTPVTEVPKPKM